MILYDHNDDIVSADNDLVESLETIYYSDYCGWPQVSTPSDKIGRVHAHVPEGSSVTEVSITFLHLANETMGLEVISSNRGVPSQTRGASIDTLRFPVPTSPGDAYAYLWDLQIVVPTAAGSNAVKKLPLKVKVRRGGPGW